jgi:nitric oxide reductase subunit C
MNKRQARLFAIGSTVVATLVFLGLTLDSHRQFGKLTNAENITPSVSHGKDVWHKYNCINCHTLFGEGAYYAPDLTKIAQHRGATYLAAYMRDPSKFYDENRHRRLMPKQNLSELEITDLISFLDWVSKVDNQGWPPRPLLVVGASFPGTNLTEEQAARAESGSLPPGARPVNPGLNPIALGQSLFQTVTPACAACHSVADGVNMAGPSLGGIATRSLERIASADYKGQAKDAESYIRESIENPSAYSLPGAMYSADGRSFMPPDYAKTLTPEQIDQLVAYLASLK